MERYSSYKDSGVKWLGEIPGHWEVKPIRHILGLANEKTISNGGNVLSLSQYFGITPKGDDSSSIRTSDDTTGYNVVHKGQFVMNIMLAWNGSYAVSDYDGIISPAYCVYNFITECDKKYYDYLLRLKVYAGAFKTQSKGIVDSRLRLYPIYFKTFPVLIPPLAEQRAMSAYLDRATAQLDAAIAREQQMIDLLNERKRIIIQQAVTKGLDPNAKLKPSGVEWIGDVPEGWEVKRLKAASLSLTKGNGITKDEVFIDGDIPCVRYGEIYSKYNNSFVECLSKTKEGQIKSPRYFEHGDILFAGTGELVAEIGKSIVYMGHEKCMAGGDIIVMKHANNPVFMNYALNAQYAQDQKSYSKAKLKVVHISASEIGNVMLAIPPYGEQQAIATFLDEISEKINKAIKRSNALISLLQERKQILISEVVTGKIKVS